MQHSTLNNLAKRAGFLYALLIPLGIFSLLYVPDTLLVPNDAAGTMNKLSDNLGLFRASIAGAFAIQLVQAFVAMALYDLFKSVHKGIASTIVLFTFAAIPMALANELSHVAILYFMQDGEFAAMFTPEQIAQWTNFLLNLNADGVMITSLFWGLWLLPMGYLAIKSGLFPKWLGWALIVAFICYVVDVFIWILAPGFTFRFTDSLGWGEAIFPLW
jgi:hypothetical protein